MSDLTDVRLIAVRLADRTRSEDPRAFPQDPDAADKAGLYSWWADEAARELFACVGGVSVEEPVYVGQAGATSWPSGRKSTATLKNRIRSNHIRGNMSSSTFRLTISAILREPLDLRLEGGRLGSDANRRVSR